jgi:hypothetical protein
MNFKIFKILALAIVLAVSPAFAGEISKADQKWTQVVEQMIEDGQAEISTSHKTRVEIAKQLAKKHGKKIEVVKKGKAFHLRIS